MIELLDKIDYKKITLDVTNELGRHKNVFLTHKPVSFYSGGRTYILGETIKSPLCVYPEDLMPFTATVIDADGITAYNEEHLTCSEWYIGYLARDIVKRIELRLQELNIAQGLKKDYTQALVHWIYVQPIEKSSIIGRSIPDFTHGELRTTIYFLTMFEFHHKQTWGDKVVDQFVKEKMERRNKKKPKRKLRNLITD